MHRAKEGDRVRESEGKRERDGEWERTTQFGGEASTDNPIGEGWTFVTFNDLWGHTYPNEIFAYS